MNDAYQAQQQMANIQTLLGEYAGKLDEMKVISEKADTSKMLSADELLCHVGWMIAEMPRWLHMLMKVLYSMLIKSQQRKKLRRFIVGWVMFKEFYQ